MTIETQNEEYGQTNKYVNRGNITACGSPTGFNLRSVLEITIWIASIVLCPHEMGFYQL